MYFWVTKKVLKQQIIDLDGFNFVIQPSKKMQGLLCTKPFMGF